MVAAATLPGGAGGCGGAVTRGASGGSTRDISGTISQSSLSNLTLRSKNQAGLTVTLKSQSLSCTDVEVCCAGYDGSTSAAAVGSDCTFALSLPLDSFCYCALFTGADADGDGCGDEYVASLGCSEGGYSGAIPIFADDDDSTDAIDLGTSTVQGSRVVAQNDPCSQVDSDDDGTSDESDTDDDGDGTLDTNDFAGDDGCLQADEFDGDDNNIPDIFESDWADLADADADDIPDFCDATACEASEEDTNGNCVPDEFDEFLEDDDEDGFDASLDCDDGDAAIGLDCYLDDICALDLDGDGVLLCDDCDDLDPANDLTVDQGCDVACTQSATCSSDFECQLFADDDQTDAFETDNVECIDGCCELIE